jgi:hypothetical protein
MKDHLIPHLTENTMAKEMFDSLVSLFQNMNRKMGLMNKLKLVQMSRSDNVSSYLMRITLVRDQLVAIEEKIEDTNLMNVALNGLPKSWEPLIKVFCARENLPYW